MSDDDLLKTPLHDLHVELGARLVPFAGYAMPVQYPMGVLGEHRHTRAAAAEVFIGPLQAFGVIGNFLMSSFGVLLYTLTGDPRQNP